MGAVVVVIEKKDGKIGDHHSVVAPKPRKPKVVTMRYMIHLKARIKVVRTEALVHRPLAVIMAHEATPR